VVAFGRGGATETVVDGVSGVFFAEQTVEAICAAVNRLADIEINPQAIAAHASQFGRQPFVDKMRRHIDGLLAERRQRSAAATLAPSELIGIDHR
jgi:hypothetical protein